MKLLTFVLILGSLALTSCKKSGSVEFLEPQNGAEVGSTFTVKFKATGMTEQASGPIVENTGHHHIIVNGAPIPKGQVIPKDETHIHYGGGEKEGELTLTPGTHKLTLQFADGAHRSYGAEWSKTISITVK